MTVRARKSYPFMTRPRPPIIRRMKRAGVMAENDNCRPDADLITALAGFAAPLFGTTASEILGPARVSDAGVTARMAMAYTAHTVFGWDYTRTGAALGRNRTTARHACRSVEDWRDDPDFNRRLTALETAASALAETVPTT